MANKIADAGTNNSVVLGKGVTAVGAINGSNNTIEIGDSGKESTISLRINGNNNRIIIGPRNHLAGLSVHVGSHVLAHNTLVRIGTFFTIQGKGVILMYNSGNRLTIGDECMFSNNVTVRGGESPHLIFDRLTGEYLDLTDGISIGNHVWVGEGSYLTKRTGIAKDCVVGARSVVTKRFDEPYCAIAGNPAKVVRRNVEWVRNGSYLAPGSAYHKSYSEWSDSFPRANLPE